MYMINSTEQFTNSSKKMRAEQVPISGLLMKEKALYFAKELSFENFQASDGRLGKWKKKQANFFSYYYSLGSISLRISLNFSAKVNNPSFFAAVLFVYFKKVTYSLCKFSRICKGQVAHNMFLLFLKNSNSIFVHQIV